MTAGELFHIDAMMRVAIAEALEQGRPFCLLCRGSQPKPAPVPAEDLDLID